MHQTSERIPPAFGNPPPDFSDVFADFHASMQRAFGPMDTPMADRWSLHAVGPFLWIRSEVSPRTISGLSARVALDVRIPFAITIDVGRSGEANLQLRQDGNVVTLAVVDYINDADARPLLDTMADAIESKVREMLEAGPAAVPANPPLQQRPEPELPKARKTYLGSIVAGVALLVLTAGAVTWFASTPTSTGGAVPVDDRFVPLGSPLLVPAPGPAATPDSVTLEPDPRFKPLN